MIVKNTLVILVLVLTFFGQVQGEKIYGGHEAVAHSRPYMVILERHIGPNNKRYCDGFLLNEEFVLTAAHCHASSYFVLLGVHNFHDPCKQKISVEKSFPHEGYHTNETIYNDIMLLKLSMKAVFNKNVRPIGFAGKDDYIRPNNCLVPGWGNSDGKKGMTDKLMEVNVTIIDNDRCAILLYEDENAENHFYCSVGNKGPASGDSGGPLVCEDGLAHGVVSFTIPTSPVFHEPVYGFTKIADYKEWIEKTMKLC